MDNALPLGREVAYPAAYDPSLLFPIPRALGRDVLGLAQKALPFVGADRWHAYELGWLDPRGKPVVRTATITVPATSPNLIESKSLKLYLNSLNDERVDGDSAVRSRIVDDLSRAAEAMVDVSFGLPAIGADARDADAGISGDGVACIDHLDVACDQYAAPDPTLLTCDDGVVVEETLASALLKSNCPVTGQPDWASVRVSYRGPRIDRAGLLRYLVSYRHHAGFHEQCVERIFIDVLARCAPQTLAVDARYTRRGGLDINPWRTTPGRAAPVPSRDLRQ